MGIDWSLFAIPKTRELRVEEKQRKRLTEQQLEALARREVRKRDGMRCAVPGCREDGIHLHHIVYRSKSRALKWHPSNLVYLCRAHHDFEHAGKITISGTGEDLIVVGDKKILSFKL